MRSYECGSGSSLVHKNYRAVLLLVLAAGFGNLLTSTGVAEEESAGGVQQTENQSVDKAVASTGVGHVKFTDRWMLYYADGSSTPLHPLEQFGDFFSGSTQAPKKLMATDRFWVTSPDSSGLARLVSVDENGDATYGPPISQAEIHRFQRKLWEAGK